MFNIAPGRRDVACNCFSYFSIKMYIVGTHLNRIITIYKNSIFGSADPVSSQKWSLIWTKDGFGGSGICLEQNRIPFWPKQIPDLPKFHFGRHIFCYIYLNLFVFLLPFQMNEDGISSTDGMASVQSFVSEEDEQFSQTSIISKTPFEMSILIHDYSRNSCTISE